MLQVSLARARLEGLNVLQNSVSSPGPSSDEILNGLPYHQKKKTNK